MGDDRRPTYLETRYNEETGEDETVRVWRASGLGACDRSLIMHALGMEGSPTPQAVQDAYDAGHGMEQTILDGMKRILPNGGWRELDRHELWHPYNKVQEGHSGGDASKRDWQVELELDCGKWKGVRQVVRCHPDAIAMKVNRCLWNTQDGREGPGCVDENGTRRVVDAKFLRPTTYGNTAAKVFGQGEGGKGGSEFYKWQVSVEMHASGLGFLGLIGWKEDGSQELDGLADPYVLDVAPYSLGQVKARVLGLAKKLWVAEEEGLGGVGCSWAMYPCPFYDSHDGQEVWERGKKGGVEGQEWWEGLDSEQQQRVTYWAGKVEAAREMMKAKDRERKAAAEKLQEVLRELGWEGVGGDGVGEDGTGQEMRVCAGWKVTRVVEPDKPERMVKFKASKGFEYVKVTRVKGAGE